jgi:hypothetical protein
MSTKHTPGRQCDACEGFCLQPALILRDPAGHTVHFKYTAATEIVFTMPCSSGPAEEVCVVGGEDGAYDWVHLNGAGEVLNHSDAGYGCADVALRDGLIAQSGGPLVDVVETLISQFTAAGIRPVLGSNDPGEALLCLATITLANFKRGV